MKLAKLMLALLCAAFTVIAAVPQDADEAAFTAAMKTVLPTNGSFRKNVEAKDSAAAKADAAKLEAIFKTSEEFWTKRKAQDAIDLSKAGRAAAAEMGKLAGAGEWDKIAAEAAKAQATCKACHDAHRGGSREAGWTIK
jgi:cytochrome c556